jgi:hypothetical protein
LFCVPWQGASFSPVEIRAGKLSLQPEAIGAAERLMEVEVGAPWIPDRCRAWEGSPDRLAQRNGYCNRETRAGTVELPILELRRLVFSELSRAAADQPGPCRYCAPCGGSHFYYCLYINTQMK